MYAHSLARLFLLAAILPALLCGDAIAQGKPASPALAPAPTAALFCGEPGEPPPPDLARALAGAQIPILPGGALVFAGQTLGAARKAVLELRCGEALPALEQAEERLLQEAAVEDSKPLLAQIESLLLLCADRLGDGPRALRAADRLLMTAQRPPPDVALVLQRYRPKAVAGPPAPPVRVETDPRGAQVIRNLLKVGQSPTDVPGGNPSTDLLDVEIPGWRKVHRPLGSGETLSLLLRPEDRLPVLVDAACARPPGSDEQAAALSLLGALQQTGHAPPRIVVLAPQQRGGAPVPGERLRARLYDVTQRRWLGALTDVAAGAAAAQAKQIAALTGGQGVGKAAPAPAQAKAQPEKKTFSFLGISFRKTKWYTWVIAGGVAALIAGLLIAEQVGSDAVTVHASK
jgi:hypothetical protein